MRLTLTLLLPFMLAGLAHAASPDDKIRAAMASDVRTEAEVLRDANRKPVETLKFFRLRDDMRVLELLPGGGWYTKILAPVLRENGEFHVSIGTGRVSEGVLQEPGFDDVNVIEVDAEIERDGPFRTASIGKMDFGVSDLDLVVTFRNMHNFTDEGRANINDAVYDALKPGGLYGVVDHTRRHMEPLSNENRRRADVVQIIAEVQAAGFRLLDYSDLHYRPVDELRLEVGAESVTGRTDRFTLLFERLDSK